MELRPILKKHYYGVLIAAILIVLYWNYIPGWLSEWSDPDGVYAFGFFVLGFIIYLTKTNYQKFLELSSDANPWGILFLLLGMASYIIGSRADIDQGVNLSLPLFIAGFILSFYGLKSLKFTIFPIILLIFALPILPIYRLTLPLQLISTQLSASIIHFLGVASQTEGTTIYIEQYRISVVAACSGLRSSSTLFFMSLIFCYFINAKLALKSLFVALSIPLAVLVNAIRIAIVGFFVLYNGYNNMQEFHDGLGIVTFIISISIMIIAARFIDKKETHNTHET